MKTQYDNDKQANILIIDDVPANLMVLTEIMKEAGLNARPVTNVKQAMQAINALIPHLILMDITMPDIDGYEYCMMLKKNVRTRDIPVIFISALHSTKDRIRGFECGAVDYITKPFEKNEVMMRVNTHLKIYRMQKELEVYNKKLQRIVSDQLFQIAEERRKILYALAKLTESRNGTSSAHYENVAKVTKLLAMGLQFTKKYEKLISNDFIDRIVLAAPLHDIGKLTIPDQILRKPGKLTEDEAAIMKRHTELGAATLREIYSKSDNNQFILMAIDIANYHHERFDGTGYPKGLSGTGIPLAARIIAVADSYDMLLNERFFKKAFGHNTTMKILNEESGKSFDPDVIDILNRIQRQVIKGTVRTNIEEIGDSQEIIFEGFDSRG